MGMIEAELISALYESIKQIRDNPNLGEHWLEENLPGYVKGFPPNEYLYQPDKALLKRLEDYERWCQTKKGEDPGKLMEEIAYLGFRGLKGWDGIKCYQSYAAQHDLVITGSEYDWRLLIEYLHLDWIQRTIIVEAKNTDEKVNDQQFSRLCGILQNKFETTGSLGVFFTRNGATGFSDGNEGKEQVRRRVLRDAQATQVLFHAKTKKFVVVFVHEDIQSLKEPGSLPRLLEAKIRAVEEWTGLSIEFSEDYKEIDLPEHMAQYL
jgi:hypothetical protein